MAEQVKFALPALLVGALGLAALIAVMRPEAMVIATSSSDGQEPRAKVASARRPSAPSPGYEDTIGQRPRKSFQHPHAK